MVFSRYATQDINSLHAKKRPIRAFFFRFYPVQAVCKTFFTLFAKSYCIAVLRHGAVCKGLSRLDGLICSQYVKEMFVPLV